MSNPLGDAHAFILAGGRGTRFWPLSRHSRPKQFLDFTGEGALLGLTAARLEPLVPAERQWVITSEDLAPLVREVAPSIPSQQILAEPEGRNTAPAVGLAAALLEARGGDRTPFAVLPSDHLISPGESFRAALGEVLQAAATGDDLFTFGVVPHAPETGYGYIEAATPVEAGRVAKVAAFHEKPELALAEEYVRTGRHLWNSGIFAWNHRSVLEQLQTHEPEMVAALRELAAAAEPGTDRFAEVFQKAYARCRSISIDYALLEKSDRVRVMGAPFDWNDVGHWNAMADLWPQDQQQNASPGQVLAIDAHGNVVHGGDALTALIGVDSLVVVNTGDVTLVCARDRAQDIKGLLEQLRERGLDRYL